MLFISFLLIGCAWAAMLALPFTILTNALSGGHMGTYLGLFNGTICIPQIIAAALGRQYSVLVYSKRSTAPRNQYACIGRSDADNRCFLCIFN